MPNMKAYALDYLSKGFRPIPCQPRGKSPLIAWKEYQDRPPSISEIESWWEKTPDANIALVLGHGVFALDVDGPQGHRELQARGIVVSPGTPTSLTGKGVHYLFTGDVPDRVGLLPQVDVRGRGIVVVPPSIHPSGRQYVWLCPPDRLPEPPDALQALFSAVPLGAVAPAGPSWLAEALAGVGEGLRNATCTRLAGYFLGKGTPREAVEQLLLAWADRCSPKMNTHEVLRCVESIAQREGVHDDDPRGLGDKLLSISTLYDIAPKEHEWILENYIPRGALVMLASEEKVGKSTWTYALVAAVSRGRLFLGFQTMKSPILMLAVEEHTTDIRMRCEMFGMTRHDPIAFYVGDLGHDAETMRELTETVITKGVGLVILDTLGHHIAGELESENDSMGAIKALKPWLRLARETNAAVVVIHHTVKGGANYRGSTAFGGIVDQLLLLRSAGGNFRDIEAKGRYWTTPKQLRVVLEGNEYRVLA